MIKVDNYILKLDFEPQLYENKKIRLSGIAKNTQIPAQWINGGYKHHYIYTFRYIGTDKFVSFELDYYGKFVGKC